MRPAHHIIVPAWRVTSNRLKQPELPGLAEANADAAPNYSFGGYGWYGEGWYWDPWFAAYTFMPGDGIFYSPFGWGFYSPWCAYAAPYFGGHYYHHFNSGYRASGLAGHYGSTDSLPITASAFTTGHVTLEASWLAESKAVAFAAADYVEADFKAEDSTVAAVAHTARETKIQRYEPTSRRTCKRNRQRHAGVSLLTQQPC